MKILFLTTLLIFFTLPKVFGQTFICGDTLIDTRDGKKYATVLIGSDCWLKQNLNYGTYVQSNSLGIIHSQQKNNGIAEKYAQQNDTNNLAIYGGLYEQSELMNYSLNPQGLCPNGWHVSTDQEWKNIINNAGGTIIGTSGTGGNALKAIGEGFGLGTGTDIVGISLKHGGDRDGYGIFYGSTLRAIYWTSTNSSPGQAFHYTLWAENDTIQRLSLGTTTTAFSCRCVKDMTAGVNENSIEGSGSINVFPNPTNSLININITSFSGQLTVYNSIGQIIKSISLPKQGNNNQIDISSWQKGIYLMQFVNSDGQMIKSQKLIIE
jgi:uncharacterized protein (TIGR02145 family)